MKNTFTIKNEQLKALISPRHGAIVQILDNGQNSWLWSSREPNKYYIPESGGCFPLTPYSNRVRDGLFRWAGQTIQIADNDCGQPHALHGDGWMSEWHIQEKSDTHMRLHHKAQFPPFDYQATQTISLVGNQLGLELSIIHLGNAPLPYGLGFHPWFPLDSDTCLWAPAEEIWEEDASHLPIRKNIIPKKLDFKSRNSPTPDTTMNNLFVGWKSSKDGSHNAFLDYPSRKKSIEITASSLLNRYMLYTDGNNFICFEPVSHNVNAHNCASLGGLQVLNYGESLAAKMTLTIKSIE